jgi:hypothetical protein
VGAARPRARRSRRTARRGRWIARQGVDARAASRFTGALFHSLAETCKASDQARRRLLQGEERPVAGFPRAIGAIAQWLEPVTPREFVRGSPCGVVICGHAAQAEDGGFDHIVGKSPSVGRAAVALAAPRPRIDIPSAQSHQFRVSSVVERINLG